jgi:putative lipoprotein
VTTHTPGTLGCLLIVVVTVACGPSPQGDQSPTAPRPDPWRDARGRGIEFRAIGQEPGWLLEIDEGVSMRLSYDYGERTAQTAAPLPSVSGQRRTYSARTASGTMTVVIEDRPCQDVMSGDPFPTAVTVTINGRELRGCGRSP